jgi:GAF domain-containing protein
LSAGLVVQKKLKRKTPNGKHKSALLLYQVSKMISSNRYLDEIMLMIVQLTAQVTGSKICSMMLLNESKDKLVIKATQCLGDEYQNKPPVKVDQSVSGKAVLTKKPVTIKDVHREEDYQYPDIARSEGVCSLAAIPMIAKDHVVGVLNCYTADEHEFSKEELQILRGVANQAAMAVENTQLLADKIEVFEKLEARKAVDKAKRILMKRHNVTEDGAYKTLQKQSMDKRKSLKEISEAIILSTEIQL